MASLGICAIIRNEALYLREWIAFHVLQGVSQFRLYDNGSSDDTEYIIKSAQHCNLTLINWVYPKQHFDRVQRRAYLDGASKLIGSVDFVAFIDVDEFLFAETGQGLAKALDDYDSNVGAIAINQRIFGSSGRRKYSNGYVTSRFIKSTEPTDPESRWVKTIARPECVEIFDSVHSVKLRQGCYVLRDGAKFEPESRHPGCSARIAPSSSIGLYHYMLKSIEEYEWKQIRWRHTKIADRYNSNYFEDRNAVANKIRLDRLAAYRSDINHMIKFIWQNKNVNLTIKDFAGKHAIGRSPDRTKVGGEPLSAIRSSKLAK